MYSSLGLNAGRNNVRRSAGTCNLLQSATVSIDHVLLACHRIKSLGRDSGWFVTIWLKVNKNSRL